MILCRLSLDGVNLIRRTDIQHVIVCVMPTMLFSNNMYTIVAYMRLWGILFKWQWQFHYNHLGMFACESTHVLSTTLYLSVSHVILLHIHIPWRNSLLLHIDLDLVVFFSKQLSNTRTRESLEFVEWKSTFYA